MWYSITIELPLLKRKQISTLLRSFASRDKCSIREFAEFIDTLVATCPAVKYGFLYTKSFEREKFKALIVYDQNFDRIMVLAKHLMEDFIWWKNRILTSVCRIKKFSFKLEIFSDATPKAWGAYCKGKSARGFWSILKSKLHINNLELGAVFMSSKTFAKNNQSCEILLRIDNTTAVCYVNRIGGTQYLEVVRG